MKPRAEALYYNIYIRRELEKMTAQVVSPSTNGAMVSGERWGSSSRKSRDCCQRKSNEPRPPWERYRWAGRAHGRKTSPCKYIIVWRDKINGCACARRRPRVLWYYYNPGDARRESGPRQKVFGGERRGGVAMTTAARDCSRLLCRERGTPLHAADTKCNICEPW